MPLAPFLAMHIPDGFVSVPVAVFGWLLMVVLIGWALRQTRDQLGERQVSLLGILAAFVFAAQMINFPVAGGTSGHLIGGVLIAVLVGPWAAALVMMAVLAVQSLIFQDGGLLALGFNVFNMGIISPFTGYAVYQAAHKLLGTSGNRALAGAALGAWVSVEIAALAASLELAVSGTAALNVALPAMVGIHALIGAGEALITVGALAFIRQARPDLLGAAPYPAARQSAVIAAGLAVALAVALVSPLADPNPDGLERVAEDKAFSDQAESAPFEILPDYTVPLIGHEALTTMAAGVIGVMVVAGVGYGVPRLARRRIR
jgi:cobalt/nickel transport system permease protein